MDNNTNKSSVIAPHAAVCSDQPVATSIGIEIMKKGGNAADAAVATIAAVSVVQPFACGIGGDSHCLFYRNSDRKVFEINGSGRSGENSTIDKIISAEQEECISNRGLFVAVPGAVAGMFSLIKNFGSGKLTMGEILAPAIKLAEEGVPVPNIASNIFRTEKHVIKNSKQASDVMKGLECSTVGQKLFSPKLAESYKKLISEGVNGFYRGKIAENIVKEVRFSGGVLTLNDMEDHLAFKSRTELQDALFIDFHGFRIWEMRPNTIGLVALVSINILKFCDLKAFEHNSGEYIHIITEVIKRAYIETWSYLGDPAYCKGDFKFLLSDEFGRLLKTKIDLERASNLQHHEVGGNTSYVAAVDSEGNGCSFIMSLSSWFGSGIIPEDCGFVLNNRLTLMSSDENSPHCYGPKKLPMHSNMPGLITDIHTNELLAVFGVCGRWMQPQGQIQVLLNMTLFGMDPQMALNQPRFYVGAHECLSDYIDSLAVLRLEDGIPDFVVPLLQSKGHNVEHPVKCTNWSLFGQGHIIAKPALWKSDTENCPNSWYAASDPRTDGSSLGF